MADDTDDTEAQEEHLSVAAQLSGAREAQGLSVQQIAERTRLPMRHIRNLENGDYSALPGNTYAVGFTRSYARTLNLDENALIEQLRHELDIHRDEHHYVGDDYAPADPGRIPPKFFTWGAIAILAIIVIGYFLLRGTGDSPTEEIPIEDVPAATATAEETTAVSSDEQDAAPAKGPVVLTANQDVWLRVYEEDGDRLFENRLTKGESYTVPSDAKNPLILTGRPQALDVTVGGKAVPRLGKADYTVADLPISAEALAARSQSPADEDEGGENE